MIVLKYLFNFNNIVIHACADTAKIFQWNTELWAFSA